MPVDDSPVEENHIELVEFVTVEVIRDSARDAPDFLNILQPTREHALIVLGFAAGTGFESHDSEPITGLLQTSDFRLQSAVNTIQDAIREAKNRSKQ